MVFIGQPAQREFREFNEEATAAAVFPTLENTLAVGITGRDLKKAEVVFNSTTGEPNVGFEMTDAGGKKFADVTTRLVGKSLAIFLDNFAISAPVVQTAITEGKGTISGQFSPEEAKRLALQLSAGALPAPVTIIEQKNVGATLGQKSVAKSLRAGAVGLLLVALFMVLYYGALGVIADVALIIY